MAMGEQEFWQGLVGQVIDGKYRLRALLGRGSSGGVLRAEEEVGGRSIGTVAVKLIQPNAGLPPERQLQELVSARQVNHPHILRCYTVGQCELAETAFLYMVLELADESLQQRLEKAPLNSLAVYRLAQQVTAALGYLHTLRPPVVHRDLKPGNLLRFGEVWKLADFGVARLLESGDTVEGTFVGTRRYMPPESYIGQVSTAWDLWSLGAMLVEALTGKAALPLDSVDPVGEALEAMERRADLPAPLLEVMRGCLRPDHRHRITAAAAYSRLTAFIPAAPAAEAETILIPPVADEPADPLTLIVAREGERHYATISEAVAHAPTGARILVRPGVYPERVVVQRPVEIRGDGPREKIILASSADCCLHLKADYAIVRGLTLRCTAGAGEQGPFGLLITHGHALVEECDITSQAMAGVGIFGETAMPHLRACRIFDGGQAGIIAGRQGGGIIERCDIFRNPAGVYITGESSLRLQQCRIFENTQMGVLCNDAGRNSHLDRCEIFANGEHGVYVGEYGDPRLTRCTVAANQGCGIVLGEWAQGEIDACRVYRNGQDGIRLEPYAFPQVCRCRVNGNQIGVRLTSPRGGAITFCDLTGNAHGAWALSKASVLQRRCNIGLGPTALAAICLFSLTLADRGLARLRVLLAEAGRELLTISRELLAGVRQGLRLGTRRAGAALNTHLHAATLKFLPKDKPKLPEA